MLALIFFSFANAQIVNILDNNFKAKLLESSSSKIIAKDLSGNYFKIDADGDGDIQVSEAQNVSYLNVSYSGILSLEGISFFSQLNYLDCFNNPINTLDFTTLPNLEYLNCSNIKLTSIDVTPLIKLKYFYCSGNQLASLDIKSLVNLQSLGCSYNKLTFLEVTPLVNLKKIYCSYNQLTSLELKGLVNLENIDCSYNQLSLLDLTGVVSLNSLLCNNNNIKSLGLAGLVNLTDLVCSENELPSIDVTDLVNLTGLFCHTNLLASLDVTRLVNLKYLVFFNNKLTSINLAGLVNLRSLNCGSNELTSLNLNSQINLNSLSCEVNRLTNLFIKNTKIDGSFSFSGNKNLEYICVNDNQLKNVQNLVNIYRDSKCQVNTYCSFVPGGTFYTIQGSHKIDVNMNGCDSDDVVFPNLNFSITDGKSTGRFISNSSGNYSIPVGAGTYSITPILENPNYFTVSPATISVTFPAQTSPFIQNFCVAPNGVHNDLEITILPTIPARPGFDATYKIIYKNKGNQMQSGSVVLSFNDAVLDLVSAIPATNSEVIDKLTWDYTNLKPLESREITITFNVNSPMETPAVNNGDRLSFNALINPVAGDEKPVDNSFALRQTVVGSYDPNDKTCLEGDVITPDLIGEYVHYLIRFENTGTYPAQNVVIKDIIDLSKFDISTLIPTKASHDFVTKISDNNKVEFIFENIQLPFDDATNDGYIAFKIKTLPTLKVGDSFQNEANIYFDYNFPILTNTAKSTFQTLGTQDFQFSDYFSLYPNPVNDIINIQTKSTIEVKSMAVYDILGQIIIAVPDVKTVSNIDVSKLSTGNYFLKMNTNKGTSNVKFVKK